MKVSAWNTLVERQKNILTDDVTYLMKGNFNQILFKPGETWK